MMRETRRRFLLQNGRKRRDAGLYSRILLPDEIRVDVRRPAQPRAMHVKQQHRLDAIRQCHDCLDFRIDRVRPVVPRMVVRLAVLPLVAVLHAILVGERHGVERVFLIFKRIRRDLPQHPFQRMRRHRLLAVVASRHQNRFRTIPPCQQFDGTSFPRTA